MVVEDARWGSRHLLQEFYDNESKLYSEPEKNCTEPGKTAWEAKCVLNVKEFMSQERAAVLRDTKQFK